MFMALSMNISETNLVRKHFPKFMVKLPVNLNDVQGSENDSFHRLWAEKITNKSFSHVEGFVSSYISTCLL